MAYDELHAREGKVGKRKRKRAVGRLGGMWREKAWAEFATNSIIHIDVKKPEACGLASSARSGTRARPSHEQQRRLTPERPNRANPRLQGENKQNANIDKKKNNKGSADKSSQIERHERVLWLPANVLARHISLSPCNLQPKFLIVK